MTNYLRVRFVHFPEDNDGQFLNHTQFFIVNPRILKEKRSFQKKEEVNSNFNRLHSIYPASTSEI